MPAETNSLTINQPATKQFTSPSGRKLSVTRKIRTAIDAMVWQGLKRAAAAKQAGIVEHSLYVALRSPHVKAYYLQQLDVLRTSERARNIHTLAEVRDQTGNQMARVQAVKALEQISDDETGSRGSQSLPGLQIVIVQGASLTQPMIDVTNTKDTST